MTERHGNWSRYDAGRYDRDRQRRLAMSSDIPKILGALTEVTEAVELVGVDRPPPPQDRRCVVCGGMDCACPQPGGSARGSSDVADPTLTAWLAIEHAVARARRRYAELVRDVILVGEQVGLDLDDRLEPVAVTLDPTCPTCERPEDHPDCDHHPPGRVAWARTDRDGRSTLVTAFRHAEQAVHGALSDVQDTWMLLLEPDDGPETSETTLAWSQKAVRQLATAARKLLHTLVAVDHPDAGKVPPTCACEGDNCSHDPGDCEALTTGRCSACRQRDSRANRAGEGAA